MTLSLLDLGNDDEQGRVPPWFLGTGGVWGQVVSLRRGRAARDGDGDAGDGPPQGAQRTAAQRHS